MNKKWALLFIPIIIFLMLFIPDGADSTPPSEEIKEEKVSHELEDKTVNEIEEAKNDKEVHASSSHDHKKDSDIINVLVIGVDEGSFDNSRSDVMILVSITRRERVHGILMPW